MFICDAMYFNIAFPININLMKSILAHLSQRLIGELIVYPCSGVRPSSVRPSSVVVHNFKDLL